MARLRIKQTLIRTGLTKRGLSAKKRAELNEKIRRWQWEDETNDDKTLGSVSLFQRRLLVAELRDAGMTDPEIMATLGINSRASLYDDLKWVRELRRREIDEYWLVDQARETVHNLTHDAIWCRSNSERAANTGDRADFRKTAITAEGLRGRLVTDIARIDVIQKALNRQSGEAGEPQTREDAFEQAYKERLAKGLNGGGNGAAILISGNGKEEEENGS